MLPKEPKLYGPSIGFHLSLEGDARRVFGDCAKDLGLAHGIAKKNSHKVSYNGTGRSATQTSAERYCLPTPDNYGEEKPRTRCVGPYTIYRRASAGLALLFIEAL